MSKQAERSAKLRREKRRAKRAKRDKGKSKPRRRINVEATREIPVLPTEPINEDEGVENERGKTNGERESDI
jgi:hypothetical protein